jgi:uncharacterized protein
MIIVADSSPLISFAILSLLGSLEKVFSEIIVPNEVFRELTESQKPFSSEIKNFLQGKVFGVENILAVQLLKKEIDSGESKAIVLALEKNYNLILIDDFKGRKIAELNGLTPIGTLGVLLRLKKIGEIKSIEPLIETLVNYNIRISDDLKNKILDLASEN